jgi:hypothetical protein
VRDFRVDAPDVDQAIAAGVTSTFEEDRDALEWIDALKARDERKVQVWRFASDRPGMLVRMAIQNMADQESRR